MRGSTAPQTLTPPVSLAWRHQAACAESDVSMFPEDELYFWGKRGQKKDSTHERYRRALQAARRVCMDCPVTVECLDEAMEMPVLEDVAGMRAGLTVSERREMRRERA